MATLSVPIAESFHSLPLLAWLATAFLISEAATQPLTGKLTDIYSRRSGLVISNLFFAAGNLLCGVASNKWMMIMGRALAGIGGGGLHTISTIVVSDMVPLRKRGLWQGFSSVFFGLGNGLGGVFGGYMNDVWNWKVAFLAQIPLTAASALMVYVYLDKKNGGERVKPSIRQVDFLGSGLLVSTLTIFLLGLTSGGNTLSWNHPLITTSLLLSAGLLCVFIFVEEKVAKEPIIPVKFLTNRTVAGVCLTNLFLTMILFTFLFYLPVYLRIRGFSITSAGAALIPCSLFSALGSLFAGFVIHKTGKYKTLNLGILLLTLVATLLMSTCTLSTPEWAPTIYVTLAGTAFGGMLTVTLVAIIGAVPHKDQAVVTSLNYTSRALGAVLGVALASAVFQNALRRDLWEKLGDQADAADIIAQIRDNLDAVYDLPLRHRRLAMESCMLAVSAVFLATVGLAFLGFASGAMIRELTLPTTLTREDGKDMEEVTA